MNLPTASHDNAHWGQRSALASCGVLDRMAGGWRGVLGVCFDILNHSARHSVRHDPTCMFSIKMFNELIDSLGASSKVTRSYIHTARLGWVLHYVHNDVIKWKHFLRYWPFVRGIHWSPVNSTHKGQWRGAFMFPLICTLNKRLSKQSWGWEFLDAIAPIMTSL